MVRLFQGWLGIFGVVCIGIGLAHLFFGTATIIGGGPVNATIDSDVRFYAVLFVAYGAAYVWCAMDVPRRCDEVNLLGVIFFVGGLARFIAWAATGAPNWFYVLMIPVNLLFRWSTTRLRLVSVRRGP